MIDLHTHILPGVDDGAINMAQALEMLRNAAEDGTEIMVATPHCNIPGIRKREHQELKEILHSLSLAAQAEGIDIRLYLGQEVHVTDDLPEILQNGEVLTLAESRYLLTEFPGWTGQAPCMHMLERLVSMGYIPLIAHPERYSLVCRQPGVVENWLQLGCHIQLTAGSILGNFGREVRHTSLQLLDRGLVACIASDAHGVKVRCTGLEETGIFLEERYDEQYAKQLLRDNPEAILRNKDL